MRPEGMITTSPALSRAAFGHPSASTVDRRERLRLCQQFSAIEIAREAVWMLLLVVGAV